MKKLLVAGVDTVVGANLAAHLAAQHSVIGIASAAAVSIDGCQTELVLPSDPRAFRELAQSHRPSRIVLCGVGGDSSWHHGGAHLAQPAEISAARAWTKIARDLETPLTLIASDSVFTGPWMFHTETSSDYCQSTPAQSLRALEAATMEECPSALVVRTHAYGWSPLSDGSGWIEGILSALESERPTLFDCIPHATPILATDLAEIVDQAWEAGLSGIYHIAGAERANPHRFVRTLAGVFDLPSPRGAILAPPETVQAGFAQGETSLHTRAIRLALGNGMPLLTDGLIRLRDQRNCGFDRRFHGSRRLAASKVA